MVLINSYTWLQQVTSKVTPVSLLKTVRYKHRLHGYTILYTFYIKNNIIKKTQLPGVYKISVTGVTGVTYNSKLRINKHEEKQSKTG